MIRLLNLVLVNKSGARYAYNGEKHPGQGRENAKTYLEENRGSARKSKKK